MPAAPDDSAIRFRIDGKNYEIDPEDLELGELAALEELTGKAFRDVDLESARGIQALAWIVIHRATPSFTIEDAGRLKLSAFDDAEEAVPPPKAAKAKAA